jgi:hypothetical protein
MFAEDYPFESAQDTGQFLDEVAGAVREGLAFKNGFALLAW